jgi:secreted trypsin-like serine protease
LNYLKFKTEKGFGGGSLIRTNYVLTAASIFRGRTDTPAIALLGVTDLFDLNGIEIRSKSVSIHPQYDPINKHNDIALVELRQHVQLNEFIKTVALPMRR